GSSPCSSGPEWRRPLRHVLHEAKNHLLRQGQRGWMPRPAPMPVAGPIDLRCRRLLASHGELASRRRRGKNNPRNPRPHPSTRSRRAVGKPHGLCRPLASIGIFDKKYNNVKLLYVNSHLWKENFAASIRDTPNRSSSIRVASAAGSPRPEDAC